MCISIVVLIYIYKCMYTCYSSNVNTYTRVRQAAAHRGHCLDSRAMMSVSGRSSLPAKASPNSVGPNTAGGKLRFRAVYQSIEYDMPGAAYLPCFSFEPEAMSRALTVRG